MIKKTITYTDYDGNEVTEDFFFNLNKAEIIEKEASKDGSYTDMLKKITPNIDNPEETKQETIDVSHIIKTIKTFILDSVGIKSEDGKHFRKPEGYAEDFASSEAYSVLLSELLNNPDETIKFISGILPLDAAQRTELIEKAKTIELPART